MTVAEVLLWGTRIGAVYQEEPYTTPIFAYDPDFLRSGMEVAPVMMPLGRRNYSFPALAPESFHGLPGLLADSLPDKYGTNVMERYLADQGRDMNSLSAVERLLYTGKRGMGALEYEPAFDYWKAEDASIDIRAMVDLASQILTRREDLHLTENEHLMEQIMNVGTSAGGARAKAVVAWNPETSDIRSGQIEAGSGYEYWMVKFDGVANNKDKGERADGTTYTRIEYAYSKMAKLAGITMSDCRLYQESGCYHFMTKRFDRGPRGEKIHMQSLGAMAHFDYNMPGAYSYEQAYDIMLRIGLGQKEAEQLFRRMVFNIFAQNQDDHVKNISFLMDKSGRWQLAPAYDLTYARDSSNRWLARHQMTMNGKRENFTGQDFIACGKRMNLSGTRIRNIMDEVKTAMEKWPACAETAFLEEKEAEYIRKQFCIL
ncbi:MAG: type II toxin-antitoxin system HipA family toxin [Lachnospiraceae bacterium]|nr:type II toxin-antitoxin system HipA family toxin [Lachnospiraceae bacterium]